MPNLFIHITMKFAGYARDSRKPGGASRNLRITISFFSGKLFVIYKRQNRRGGKADGPDTFKNR